MLDQISYVFTLDAAAGDGDVRRIDHTAIAIGIVAVCSLAAFVAIPAGLLLRWL